MLQPRQPQPWSLRLAWALCGSLLGYAWGAFWLWGKVYQHRAVYYWDKPLPMLQEADGYYFLERAMVFLTSARAVGDMPLLSLLAAWAAKLSGLPLEQVAFWSPAVLAMLCGLWFAAWGGLLRLSLPVIGTAALLGALAPAWFERAAPGWFDTDPGIALFWHGCLYATACLGLARTRPPVGPALLLLFCAVILALWWQPTIVLLPLCLLLWGSTFFWAEQGSWRNLRLATAVLCVVGALVSVLLPEASLPPVLADFREYGLDHVNLVLGRKVGLVFSSIEELEPASLFHLLQGYGGTAVAGTLALCACALAVWRQPRPLVFFLPSLGTLLLALSAERFAYLAVLPVALCAALLADTGPWALARLGWAGLLARLRRPVLAGWALVALVLVSMLSWHVTRVPKPLFGAGHDRVVLALRRAAPPGARLWNWWDDGYYLAARSGLPPLFDGGSQTPEMAWIAAHPLASDNSLLAKRWMRFFALRGEAALDPLRQAWGSEDAVWANLEAVFSAADPARILAGLPPLSIGGDWLFPEGRVYLYLPQRFLRLSQWWIPLGMTRESLASQRRLHIDAFHKTTFRYDAERGQVAVPEEVLRKGYADFGGVFITSSAPLVEPFGGGKPGPYLVTSDKTPWLYIVDELAIGSVAFRLMAPGGAPLPGFAPLAVDYVTAGVWEVLP